MFTKSTEDDFNSMYIGKSLQCWKISSYEFRFHYDQFLANLQKSCSATRISKSWKWVNGENRVKTAHTQARRPPTFVEPFLLKILCWWLFGPSTLVRPFYSRESYEFGTSSNLRMSRKNTSAQGLMNFLSNYFLDRPKVPALRQFGRAAEILRSKTSIILWSALTY